MHDIGQGIRVVAAGVFYFLPLLVVYMISILLGSLARGSGNENDSAAILRILCVILPLLLLLISVFFLSAWAWLIGAFRYAIEGSGLFEYSNNIRIARRNIGPAFSLSARYVLLGVIYNGFTSVIHSNFERIVTQTITFRTPDSIIVLILTIGVVLSTTLSIMAQFSGFHLLAQFGMKIGLGPEKPKPADPDMDTSSEY